MRRPLTACQNWLNQFDICEYQSQLDVGAYYHKRVHVTRSCTRIRTDRHVSERSVRVSAVNELSDKTSSGDEIANVNFLRSAPGSYPNSLK